MTVQCHSDNPYIARTLHGNSADLSAAKLKDITLWVHITRLKQVMQPNDENARLILIKSLTQALQL